MREELVMLLDENDRRLRLVISGVGTFAVILLTVFFFMVYEQHTHAPIYVTAFWVVVAGIAGYFTWIWFRIKHKPIYKALVGAGKVGQLYYHVDYQKQRAWASRYFIKVVLENGEAQSFYVSKASGKRILKIAADLYPEVVISEIFGQ